MGLLWLPSLTVSGPPSLPPTPPAWPCSAIMLAVEKLAGDELSLKIFGATTNAAKATLFPVVDALPIQPEVRFHWAAAAAGQRCAAACGCGSGMLTAVAMCAGNPAVPAPWHASPAQPLP